MGGCIIRTAALVAGLVTLGFTALAVFMILQSTSFTQTFNGILFLFVFGAMTLTIFSILFRTDEESYYNNVPDKLQPVVTSIRYDAQTVKQEEKKVHEVTDVHYASTGSNPEYRVFMGKIDGRQIMISRNMETKRYTTTIDGGILLPTNGSAKDTVKAIKQEFDIDPKLPR